MNGKNNFLSKLDSGGMRLPLRLAIFKLIKNGFSIHYKPEQGLNISKKLIPLKAELRDPLLNSIYSLASHQLVQDMIIHPNIPKVLHPAQISGPQYFEILNQKSDGNFETLKFQSKGIHAWDHLITFDTDNYWTPVIDSNGKMVVEQPPFYCHIKSYSESTNWHQSKSRLLPLFIPIENVEQDYQYNQSG